MLFYLSSRVCVNQLLSYMSLIHHFRLNLSSQTIYSSFLDDQQLFLTKQDFDEEV